MLNERVKAYIDSLSDETLYQYARDTESGYSEEALAYAGEVLAKRNLGPEHIAALQTVTAERRRRKEEDVRIEAQERAVVAEAPLSRGWRVLFILLGFLSCLPALICCIVCRAQGKKRKAKQMLVAWLIGFAVAVLLFLATPLIRAIAR